MQKDTIVKPIVLKAKPTAACSYINNCGCLSVAVTNGSSIAAGSISSYKYFVGNTIIASMPNFSYAFAAYGSYTIKQVLQSNVGCASDTFYLPVVVKDKPITTLSFANDNVCANTNFTITSNAGVSAATVSNYFWQINGGAVQSLATNARIENLPTGIYNYKHWVSSSQGCESNTVYPTFTVVSKPTASIATTNVCGSKLVNFTVNNNVVNDVLSSFYINYGNGVAVVNNIAPANYTYPNYGSYDIKYLVKSSKGCESDTVYKSITVDAFPQTNFTVQNTCVNKPVVFTNSTTGNIVLHTWEFSPADVR